MIDKRPALIARCADVADVIAAVNFGRDNGLDIAIRGGGHNGAGLGSVDDGLVIDLSGHEGRPRRSRRPDGPRRRRLPARRRRPRHPRASASPRPCGIISTTGVGGLTLGGGIGHLTRELRPLDRQPARRRRSSSPTARSSPPTRTRIPTSSGRSAAAAATSASSRRSGSRLHPVDTVVAGPMLWPLDRAGRRPALVPRLHRRGAGGARAASSRSSASRPAPPFPEELHLQKVCGGRLVLHRPDGGRGRRARRGRARSSGSCSTAWRPMPLPVPSTARSTASIPAGRPVVLARRLRRRRSRTRRSSSTSSSPRRCRPGSRRCTCIRSTAPRTAWARPTTPWGYRDANWALGHRRRRPRPGQRRRAHATGRVGY